LLAGRDPLRHKRLRLSAFSHQRQRLGTRMYDEPPSNARHCRVGRYSGLRVDATI
jgi:hypothetical protein